MSNIVIVNKSYLDEDALQDVIRYCAGETRDYVKCTYWGGFGVRIISTQAAINDMLFTKQFYKKNDGNQLYHIVFSITLKNSGDKLTKQMIRYKEAAYCLDLAPKISMMIYKEGFQNCFFVHQDGKNAHFHIVINSVNYITGNKMSQLTNMVYKLFYNLKENYGLLQWKNVSFNDGLG